jgi:Domain of unknown function (DUF3854)
VSLDLRPYQHVNRALDLLLSPLFDGFLAPEHRADLEKSGLTDTTIRMQKIRSVPPDLIDRLLGFDPKQVVSAYILPFADPRGGWTDHVRMKVFPSYADRHGRTVKYLGPRGAAPRLYFPLVTLPALGDMTRPLYFVEGAKKALAVAQLGLPAVGFEGIEGWHVAGSRELLPDFDRIALRSRVVALVPDGDEQTNPQVARGARKLADALRAVGARPRLVCLPAEVAA